MHVREAVAAAVVVTLILILHLNACSHALSLSSGVSHNAHKSQYIRCRSSSRNYLLLAVAKNHAVSEAFREVIDVETKLPISRGSAPGSNEPGEVNTSISSGMTDMQDFWGNEVHELISMVGVTGSRAVENVCVELDHQLGGMAAESFEPNANHEKNKLQEYLDGLDDFGSGGQSCMKVDGPSDNLSDGSRIHSVMAKSALLHHSGIDNSANRSYRNDNMRSSLAKAHVNRSRGFSDKNQSANAISRVLGTVRTAAAAVAGEERKLETEVEQNDGINNVAANISRISKPLTNNLKSVIESTVADMLKFRDAPINQQSVDVIPCTNSPQNSPSGTTTMGILGDVVQDKLPDIPPMPGAYLVRAIGDVDDTQITIRTSIPHTSDDTHIANLRLSVFSRFDEEKQLLFRRQSIEVLNSRRRQGAVALVAETGKGPTRSDLPYLTDMQSRIVQGHTYGNHQNGQRSVALSVASQTFVDVPSRQTERGSIIGSVECSHQEFRGTILGNSRPKGSLMYVTEVAVRADARRCGAGALLMRGVDEVAALRNIESVYLHVDVTNHAACAMYEKCGYHYLDMREPIYAQFTASLNLHDGATQGRKHHLMSRNFVESLTWLHDNDSFWACFSQ
ncbi:hypothetical protein ACHAXH_007326 [Discostella pseudostelligera]